MATYTGQRLTLLKALRLLKSVGLIGGVYAAAVLGPKAFDGDECLGALAGPERKGSLPWDQMSRMALGAERNLRLAADSPGMHDGGC